MTSPCDLLQMRILKNKVTLWFYHSSRHALQSASPYLCKHSLINVIYTLQNQTPDFMNTRNQEQLFDREKLMMSCPESSAGSPAPWGLSLNARMSAAAGPLFGEGTCQSCLRQRESRCAGQSEKVPAQQARDQEVKRHLE